MTDIWQKFGDTWSQVGPSDFQDEDDLHDRIIEAPEMLPLSGQPKLAFAGKKVRIGGGEADVLAVDTEGRPTIIEVKLKKNPESRRAVVAQALAYAAWLHGATVEELEGEILGSYLGGKRLADALGEADPEGALDHHDFYSNLATHLADGSFRLVIVLDDAPAQLVRLTGYLETVTTERIAVDLVTVRAYEVNGAQVLVPQRIDPDREPEHEPLQPSDRPRLSRRSKSPKEPISAFRLWGEEHAASTWPDVWEGVAQALYERDPDKFATIVGYPDGKRSYVEADKTGLSKSGVATARQVGPYWIECNASAADFRKRCERLLELCDHQSTDIEFVAS